jgi:hypothetical protein
MSDNWNVYIDEARPFNHAIKQIVEKLRNYI